MTDPVFGLVDHLRRAWRRWRINRRRSKLLRAYAKIGRVQHDLGPGLSPTMYAYDRVTSEGLAVLVDGELVWLWPEDDGIGGVE